jgi:mannose-1-phosphate guanylyltransferase
MSASTTISLVAPVILCGGSAARLWSLLRSGFLKQFLVLFDDDSNDQNWEY